MKALARIFLAIVFVFSGFVKAIDPWGGAIKISEYLSAFSLDFLFFLEFPLAVLLSSLELGLGLMLLFRTSRRLAATLTLIFTSFFSLLTLYIAIFNPVADCGCFGDALKLSPWQTFFKNVLILLPLSIYVYRNARYNHKNTLSLLFVLLGLGLNFYCYITLPIIDFREFKVGVDIAEDMQIPTTKNDVETVLIYRNKLSGELHNFNLSDTTWYDTTKWVYVDTQVNIDDIKPNISDFSIYNSHGDFTNELLLKPLVYIFAFENISSIKQEYLDIAKDKDKVIVTQSSTVPEFLFDTPVFRIDATTLKTMIRAKKGLIILENGVIKHKSNLALYTYKKGRYRY